MKLFCPICKKPLAEAAIQLQKSGLVIYSDYCGDYEVRIRITPVWKPKERSAP
jgi:hypothetical protein